MNDDTSQAKKCAAQRRDLQLQFRWGNQTSLVVSKEKHNPRGVYVGNLALSWIALGIVLVKEYG